MHADSDESAHRRKVSVGLYSRYVAYRGVVCTLHVREQHWHLVIGVAHALKCNDLEPRREQLSQGAGAERDRVFGFVDRPQTVVGHEDQGAPAWPEYASDLPEEASARDDVLKHLRRNDNIVRPVRQGDRREDASMHCDAFKAQPPNGVLGNLETMKVPKAAGVQIPKNSSVAATDVKDHILRFCQRRHQFVFRRPVSYRCVPGFSKATIPMLGAVAIASRIDGEVVHKWEVRRHEVLHAPRDKVHFGVHSAARCGLWRLRFDTPSSGAVPLARIIVSRCLR